TLNAKVPRDLEVICLTCLEKDPMRRYASAQALAEDLGRYLRGESIHARQVGLATRAWMWCKRKPALVGLASALTLAVLAALFGGLGLGAVGGGRRREADARREAETGLVMAQMAAADARKEAETGLVMAQMAAAGYVASKGGSSRHAGYHSQLGRAWEDYLTSKGWSSGHAGYHSQLGRAWTLMGFLHDEVQENAQALVAFQHAVDEQRRAVAKSGEENQYKTVLCIYLDNLGEQFVDLGRAS